MSSADTLEVSLSARDLVIGSSVSRQAGEDIRDEGGRWAVAVGVSVGGAAFGEQPGVEAGWEDVWAGSGGDGAAG